LGSQPRVAQITMTNGSVSTAQIIEATNIHPATRRNLYFCLPSSKSDRSAVNIHR